MSKTIPLTYGMHAIVDDDDYERVSKHVWSAIRAKQKSEKWYAVTSTKDFRIVYLHRLIMNAGDLDEVDHRHNDGLDNRKEELRICSRSQNCANASVSRPSLSGFRGVYRKRNFWCAEVGGRGRRIIVGYFQRAEDAALARDRVARQIFGEFAVLNFPELEVAA